MGALKTLLGARSELKAMRLGKKGHAAAHAGDHHTFIKCNLDAFRIMHDRFGAIFQTTVYSFNAAVGFLNAGDDESARQYLELTYRMCWENLEQPDLNPEVPRREVFWHMVRCLAKVPDATLIERNLAEFLDARKAQTGQEEEELIASLPDLVEKQIELGDLRGAANMAEAARRLVAARLKPGHDAANHLAVLAAQIEKAGD
jgi:hypothetical protein